MIPAPGVTHSILVIEDMIFIRLVAFDDRYIHRLQALA